MTALDLYNATLIELNKVNAPTFTVEQFNYFVNKAIQAYIDQRYSFYAVNQQLTDDLRVLLSVYHAFSLEKLNNDSGQVVRHWEQIDEGGLYKTALIYVTSIEGFNVGTEIQFEGFSETFIITELISTPGGAGNWTSIRISPYLIFGVSGSGIAIPAGAVYEDIGADPADPQIRMNLLLGAKILFVHKSFKITDSPSGGKLATFTIGLRNYYHALAVRTYWTDLREHVNRDITGCDYTKIKAMSRMYPAKRLTYDMLANIESNAYLRPMYRQPYYLLHNHPFNFGTLNLDDTNDGFQNSPQVEVHLGTVPKGLTLEMVEFDYLKLPETVALTEEEVYVNDIDTSQLLEWPDYLNSEILKNLVSYFLENTANPRMQSFVHLQQDTPPVPMEMSGQK